MDQQMPQVVEPASPPVPVQAPEQQAAPEMQGKIEYQLDAQQVNNTIIAIRRLISSTAENQPRAVVRELSSLLDVFESGFENFAKQQQAKQQQG